MEKKKKNTKTEQITRSLMSKIYKNYTMHHSTKCNKTEKKLMLQSLAKKKKYTN